METKQKIGLDPKDVSMNENDKRSQIFLIKKRFGDYAQSRMADIKRRLLTNREY